MGVFAFILKRSLCYAKNLRGKVDFFTPAIAGFNTALATLIETDNRRAEITLYAFPRAL